MKGIKAKTLVLPVLGTGQQKIEPELIIKELLNCALRYLDHSKHLRKIMFVERNQSRAKQLDKIMNEVLGRIKITLPKGELIESLRKEILKSTDNAIVIVRGEDRNLFADISRLIASEQSRSFEIGIIARRLVEFTGNDISPQPSTFELYKKIDNLSR